MPVRTYNADHPIKDDQILLNGGRGSNQSQEHRVSRSGQNNGHHKDPLCPEMRQSFTSLQKDPTAP